MRPRHVLLQLGYTSKRRLEGIADFAKAHDWCITLEDHSAMPRGWTGDGVLTLLRARQPHMVAFARKLAARGIPIVDLSICHPELKLPRVVGDHAAIGALAAEHCAERRFRNVMLFAKDHTHVEELRFGGFRRRWEGPAPVEAIWRNEISEARYDDWNALVKWLASRLAAVPKPVAVFAYNDSDAARVLHTALATGMSVPEEVAILGVDDDAIVVENQPVPLSSIRHDLYRLGYESAAMLDRLMNGETLERRVVLIPPKYISVRRSTDVIAATSPLMRRALALISRNLSGTYGTIQLADDLGISRSSLTRLFQSEFASAPTAEFLRQRLAKAKLLISTTAEPMKAIAAQCGFASGAHLSNVFRRETGMTPQEFRAGGR